MNHCIRACDTKERLVTLTLRRTCDDAPELRPLSKGQSLRNFDDDTAFRNDVAILEILRDLFLATFFIVISKQ